MCIFKLPNNICQKLRLLESFRVVAFSSLWQCRPSWNENEACINACFCTVWERGCCSLSQSECSITGQNQQCKSRHGRMNSFAVPISVKSANTSQPYLIHSKADGLVLLAFLVVYPCILLGEGQHHIILVLCDVKQVLGRRHQSYIQYGLTAVINVLYIYIYVTQPFQ